MAARIRRVEHSEEVRGRIRTSQLLNRLMDHAVGKVEMTQTQIRAAEILLRKTVPDLSAVEHSGEVAVSTAATDILRGLNGTAADDVRGRVQDGGPPVATSTGDVRH